MGFVGFKRLIWSNATNCQNDKLTVYREWLKRSLKTLKPTWLDARAFARSQNFSQLPSAPNDKPDNNVNEIVSIEICGGGKLWGDQKIFCPTHRPRGSVSRAQRNAAIKNALHRHWSHDPLELGSDGDADLAQRRPGRTKFFHASYGRLLPCVWY